MKPQAILKGTVLTPIPLWNRTSPRSKKLPSTCKVIEVRKNQHSQTGVMVRVEFQKGGFVELDAAWFEECKKNQQGELKL